MTNHDQWLPAEPKDDELVTYAWDKFSPRWYRLNALKDMPRGKMEGMLAFLSGYDPVGFDKALDSVNVQINVHPDDPDYREDDEREMQ